MFCFCMLEADWYNTEMQYLCITSFILIKSAHLLSTYSKVHASPNKANLSTPVPEHPVDTSMQVAADYVNFDTDPDCVYVK